MPIRRWVVASAIMIIALGYAGAVLLGGVPEKQRIDTTVVALIAFAGLVGILLVKPDVLQDFSIFGLHVTLRKVQEQQAEILVQQAEQQEQLAEFRDTLALLLPPPEQGHLLKLLDQFQVTYKRNDVRSQLAHLRSLRLIDMQTDDSDKDGRKHFSKLPDEFALADFFRLTDLGRRWAARIKKVDAAAAQAKAAPQVPGGLS